MPELPEVETVLRGLRPHLEGRLIQGVAVRQPRLRWPVPADLDARVAGQTIRQGTRRGKYLVLRLDRGALILHLGMSGSLRILTRPEPPGVHDHVDILLEGGMLLRYRDPRRFGALLWTEDAAKHPLIAHLGLEPLDGGFDGAALYSLGRGRQVAIKQLIMNAALVVGIGNIYASESLFRAGIDPRTPAARLSRARCERLAMAIRETLTEAIAAGGSTLRDFVDSHGEPGYFQLNCAVYDRAGEPCRRCGTPIRSLRQGGRSSFYCKSCQKR